MHTNLRLWWDLVRLTFRTREKVTLLLFTRKFTWILVFIIRKLNLFSFISELPWWWHGRKYKPSPCYSKTEAFVFISRFLCLFGCEHGRKTIFNICVHRLHNERDELTVCNFANDLNKKVFPDFCESYRFDGY